VSHDVSYVPGEQVAVVGPGALVLLPADVEPRLAREVHAALVPGVGVADVLQVLTGEFATSIARIPAFALAVLSPSGVQAVARGGLAVRVGTGPGAETVSGEGVATWTERFVAGADDVALLGPGATDGAEAWPLDGGIVRAASLACHGAEVAPRASRSAAPAASPAAPSPGEPVEETVVPVETLLPSAADDSFDQLFGSTVLRPVELAAVRADEDDEVDLDLAPGASPVQAAAPAPAPATAPRPEPEDAPSSAVPAAVEPPAGAPPATEPSSAPAWTPPFHLDVPATPTPPAPPAPTPADPAAAPALGDHDGETVVRQPFEVVTPTPPAAPRGPVGRVRLSTGQEIELDRPVVVGRKPRVSRVGGTAVPRLVSVPSPEQDISRSHLEVRLEGVSVLVVDLGSTNGSTLLRTGQLPVRLHPHEAVLVVDGDVVDLGEGVTLTFEGLA